MTNQKQTATKFSPLVRMGKSQDLSVDFVYGNCLTNDSIPIQIMFAFWHAKL